jgi:hypothetical protein
MIKVSSSCTDEPLVGPKPVRERLSVGPSGFAAALRQGLPHYKINQRVLRFRLSEVDAWLEERRRGEVLT